MEPTSTKTTKTQKIDSLVKKLTETNPHFLLFNNGKFGKSIWQNITMFIFNRKSAFLNKNFQKNHYTQVLSKQIKDMILQNRGSQSTANLNLINQREVQII
jgi:hypothetical protein